MSWKLAELRWRQDVGLNESCWERDGRAGPDDRLENTKSKGSDYTKRGRSYTAPWCHAVLGKSPAQASVNNRIRPDPLPLVLATGLSDSSTTPLLRNNQDKTDILTSHHHSLSVIEKDTTQTDLSLNNFQSPSRPTSFPRRTTLCPELCQIERVCSLLDGDHLSPDGSTSPLQPDESSTHDRIRQQLKRLSPPLPINSNTGLCFSNRVESECFCGPRFGLQFCKPDRGVGDKPEGEGLDFEHCSVWSQSHSFAPGVRRVSLESTHHSDSALLQNISMYIPTSHSSPEPRTTRPLYPDLPSAYAQIQGRRAASLQPVSSNRSATRFPLSPASSSSEEDGYQDLPIDVDAIPLKNLPCRKVHSAQAILHEADHHQESSAVFESSEENSDLNLGWKRASTTLDDIVSQYADARPSGSYIDDDRINNGGHGVPDQLNTVTDREFEGDPACFETSVTRPDDVAVGNQLHGSYRHCADDQIPRNPGNFGAVDDDDDEEWVTLPESSRSSFLTPSKLRFRLAKRGTGDTSNSNLTLRRSPASPWDPLSNTIQSKPRPQQRYKGAVNADQHQRSPSPQPSRGLTSGSRQWSHKGSRTSTTTGQIADADKRSCRLDSAGASTAKAQHLRPRPLNQISPSRLTSHSPSAQSTTLSSSRRVDMALPSSSLLPGIPDKAHTSSLLSPQAMATVNGTPQGATAEQNLTIPSIYDDSIDVSDRAMADSQHGNSPLHSRNLAANNRGFVVERAEAAGSAVALDPFSSLSLRGRVPRHNVGKTFVSGEEAEVLATRQYNTGGYRLNDAEISRFLRDSRLLRQRFGDGHEHEHNGVLFGRHGTLATGSSLANLSSDSTTSNRLRCARNLSPSSNYSASDDLAGITSQVTRKFKHFLNRTGSGTTEGTNSEYSSLGSVHTSTNSTSRSLMLQELEKSFDTSDPVISCDRCPAFPLAPEMLGVLRLENLGRVPFERVQLWDDGEWLEKGWCFVHGRMEYSHAALVGNEAGISEDLRSVQRKAGRILLVFGVATFLLGGWTLIHSIGEGGPLATSAMADLTRLLAGGEEGVVCCVHPRDAAMAQAIEKAAVSVAVLVVAGVLAVLCWAAATI